MLFCFAIVLYARFLYDRFRLLLKKQVPSTFMLCKGRAWLVPLFDVGPKVRVACALPAMLLTVSLARRPPVNIV